MAHEQLYTIFNWLADKYEEAEEEEGGGGGRREEKGGGGRRRKEDERGGKEEEGGGMNEEEEDGEEEDEDEEDTERRRRMQENTGHAYGGADGHTEGRTLRPRDRAGTTDDCNCVSLSDTRFTKRHTIDI